MEEIVYAAEREAVGHQQVAARRVAQGLNAARLVDGAADGREVEPVRRADVAVNDLSMVQCDVRCEPGREAVRMVRRRTDQVAK